MPTRRELLLTAIWSPVAAAFAEASSVFPEKPQIREEAHCLSQESAKGFRLLLNVAHSAPVVILPGARDLSIEACSTLLDQVISGTWVIWETGLCFSSSEESLRSNRILSRVFGLDLRPPIRVTQSFYIKYSWPIQAGVRSFHAITPIRCHPSEAIAEFRRIPVCARRVIGKGGIVYLGSMLGPGLFAEEREAHALGGAILDQLTVGKRNCSDL